MSADSLRRRRAVECRLTRDRALRSLEEAAAFLAERGMLTRMPDCALPSLFGACHERPANPAGRGFGQWPRTKWIWSFQLTHGGRAVLTKLHRGRSLYLSMAAARVFDPLVMRAIDEASEDDALLLDFLARCGASMNEDAEHELGWDAKRIKQTRSRLERVGAIVSDGLVFESATRWYFAPMRRWDQVVTKRASSDDPHGDVVVAGVSAAVLAPEAQVATWFAWPLPRGTVQRLVDQGRVRRPSPGMLALPA